jgi:hypothetical protein
MEIVRRVYFYVVAAVSLGMLVAGIASLGATLLDVVLVGFVERTARDSIAISAALIFVGLPIWAVHWGAANRSAGRNLADRRSALRHLYLYVTAGALLVAVAITGNDVLQSTLHELVNTGKTVNGADVLRHLWQGLVAFAFWLYQLRVAALDRRAVGEEGASATIRRWYAYAVQVITLLIILFSARELLRSIALAIIQPAQFVRDQATVDTVGTLLVALIIWAYHSWWTSSGEIGLADRPSTLRAIHGFLILSVTVALTLYSASQILYYVLERALGVRSPGGIEGDLATALVNPVTTIVVFGTAWALMRARLRNDAEVSTDSSLQPVDPRRDGVRRLYSHLVALLALFTLSCGLTGVLWTLTDQLLDVRPIVAGGWRDQLALSITLLGVGLVTWLGHWRPAPPLVERGTLSRRLYLFAALLFSVLGLLGSGAALVYSLLGLVIDVPGASTSAIGRALAASLVSGAIAAYHWRVLGADVAARRAEATTEAATDEAASPAEVSLTTIVEIIGASEEQIRTALGSLPPEASYSIR